MGHFWPAVIGCPEPGGERLGQRLGRALCSPPSNCPSEGQGDTSVAQRSGVGRTCRGNTHGVLGQEEGVYICLMR